MPPLVYVMGASGVGKDSVLRFARDALAPTDRIMFAQRYITRPADAFGEKHVALGDAEFEIRRASGLFAFHWEAHGYHYGIGIEVRTWQRAGFVVVVSGSRAYFTELRPRPEGMIPVVITASPDALRYRLAARGREEAAAVAARLRRAAEKHIDDPSIITIDNSGALEHAGWRFIYLLRRAAAGLAQI